MRLPWGRRRPTFREVPVIDSIEETDEPGRYRVVLREPISGKVEATVFTVTDEEWLQPRATSTSMVWDRDVFSGWPGDSESRSAIFDQVRHFHSRARE